MKKLIVITIMCVGIMGISACGKQDAEPEKRTEDMSVENNDETTKANVTDSEISDKEASDTVKTGDVTDGSESDTGATDSGIGENAIDTGAAGDVMGESTSNTVDDTANANTADELTYEEMYTKFHEQFYSGVSNEEIEERIKEGNPYYHASKYYGDIVNYWEQIRGVTDISSLIDPLYYTDMKYYSKEDFQDEPKVVIHLAKNEIYAKHGYIFKDEDLNNYFKGCAWYRPLYGSDEFDTSVFNDYEMKNLEVLAELDK